MLAIGSALRYRNRTGRGQWIDIGMYQAGVMFLSEYLMDAIVNGREKVNVSATATRTALPRVHTRRPEKMSGSPCR